MNLQSTQKALAANGTNRSKVRQAALALKGLPRHAMCVALGLVGGATGVALVIALAILVQVLLPPSEVFWLGAIPLTVAATIIGLGASWLLRQGGRYLLPRLFHEVGDQGLQVTMIFSVFTSLLQSVLFTYGF